MRSAQDKDSSSGPPLVKDEIGRLESQNPSKIRQLEVSGMLGWRKFHQFHQLLPVEAVACPGMTLVW